MENQQYLVCQTDFCLSSLFHSTKEEYVKGNIIAVRQSHFLCWHFSYTLLFLDVYFGHCQSECSNCFEAQWRRIKGRYWEVGAYYSAPKAINDFEKINFKIIFFLWVISVRSWNSIPISLIRMDTENNWILYNGCIMYLDLKGGEYWLLLFLLYRAFGIDLQMYAELIV